MQSLSENPLIATPQLSSAASLNLARSQNGVLVNGFTCTVLIAVIPNIRLNKLLIAISA